jgi:thiopeptide-type bacteriocin biosynthesis protein
MDNTNFVVVRTPILPLSYFEIRFEKIFSYPLVASAIRHASVDLYNQITESDVPNGLKSELSLKEYQSLQKYTSRMATRCTPFGAFASVGIYKLHSNNSFSNYETLVANLAFSWKFLLHNIYANEKYNVKLKNNHEWLLNNSLYVRNENAFYYEPEYEYSRLKYTLQSISLTKDFKEILDNLVGRKFTLSYLKQLLRDKEYDESSIDQFINDLVGTYVLVPMIFPNIIGTSFHNNVFEKLGVESFQYTKKLNTDLSDGLFNELERLEKLASSLSGEVEVKDTIQINLFKKSNGNTINENIRTSLKQLIKNVGVALIRDENYFLELIKKEIVKRHGTQFVPINHILHPQTGLDLQSIEDNAMHLKSTQNVKVDNLFRELNLSLLRRNVKKDTGAVSLTNDDLKPFIETNETAVQFYSVIQIINSNENNKIHHVMTSFGSPLKVLGRFGHSDMEIKNYNQSIAQFEQNCHNDSILADIAHLDVNYKAINISDRPTYRDHQINLLSNSNEGSKSIELSNLYIGVYKDKILLYDCKSEKRIIPRMSNAHISNKNSLPIYRLLGYLSNEENNKVFSWSWGQFSKLQLLPRIEYNDIILSPKTWNLTKSETSLLTLENAREQLSNLSIPDRFMLFTKEGELAINLNLEPSIALFLSELRKLSSIRISEYLYSQATGLNGYANEVIVSQFTNVKNFSNEFNQYAKENINASSKNDWLYFKFYMSPKNYDSFIESELQNIIKYAKNYKLLSKWFFVRYFDGDHHIRLRFLPVNIESKKQILNLTLQHTSELLNQNIIWKQELSQYQKETNRYGPETMIACESLFSISSEICLLTIKKIEKHRHNFKNLIMMIGVYHLQFMLPLYNLNTTESLAFCKENYLRFIREFKLDKDRTKRRNISNGFREFESHYQKFVGGENPFRSILNQHTDKLKHYVEMINKCDLPVVKKNDLFSSLTHMHFNRLFADNQRFREMITYLYTQKILLKNKNFNNPSSKK